MDTQAKIQKVKLALQNLSTHENSCRLCPRECGVNRLSREKGFCQSGSSAAVSHALLHYGEEPVISGTSDCTDASQGQNQAVPGSGTIFFTGCNLKCCFCQNYQLSWLGHGRIVCDEELAGMMLRLQSEGAWNINLVSPTHLLLPILRALGLALERGLTIPIVYNSNGYEKAEVLRHLEGIIDIYLPDLKYFSAEPAARYSSAPDYFEHASRAIQEMFRQKRALLLNEKGMAVSGLIIRHLILPGWSEDSLRVLGWVAENLSTRVCLSLMSQFYPCFQAPEELKRTLSSEEYQKVIHRTVELGFEEIFVQAEMSGSEARLVPDFNLDKPFCWNPKTGSSEKEKSLV